MLLDRTYKPSDEELIYHYCNSDSFHAICTSKNLRLSDIFSMNDFLEMHWGYSIWEDAATNLYKELGKEFIDKVDEILHASGVMGLLLATSFSMNGDLLSQWRGYANDGTGFAIGFKAKDIVQLPIRPLKVLYNKKEQVKELENILRAVYEIEKEESFKYGEEFRESCLSIAFDLVAFKNPAFIEEQEIRIVHLLNFEKSNNSFKLIDAGGIGFGEEIKGKTIQFRMKENTPTAFIDENFTNNNKINPIEEVIIGPKNRSVPTGISTFLETVGLGNVKIKKSKASYR